MGWRIVMLGAPGAGKGTQAKMMAETYKLPHISTGDIFRAHLREGTPLGLQVKQYLDSGQLVPDELTCAIVADRTAQEDTQNGYILDGFPRSLPQAEEFQRLLERRGEKIDLAIDIAVEDAEIIKRLTARRSCPKCGAVYNLKFMPPKKDNVCDNDGQELIQRQDDKEETVRDRLDVYHETTEPIIEYYERQGVLEKVNGTDSSPRAVFKKIEDIMTAVGAA